MSFPAHTSPEDDPRNIFFDLEDDIRSVVEYVALIVSITQAADLELSKDETLGLHRLILQVKDHAIAIRDGFNKASGDPARGQQ